MTVGGTSQRQLRVAEQIRRVLAEMFVRGAFRDAALAVAHVTVTEVRITADLKHATAFVARLGRSDIDELMPALERAAPFLRGVVGRALSLRYAPELSFAADAALEAASRIEAVLRSPDVARDLVDDA
ncbi:MAG: 30S ribosome-binding factor RbfA [Acetobacteraceae bacterium]